MQEVKNLVQIQFTDTEYGLGWLKS